MRQLNAKDTPLVSSDANYGGVRPKLYTSDSLVSETDKLMVMGEHEEAKLKQFDLDFSSDAFENKLFNEDRWKGWDDERSQHKYERYRVLASYKVKNREIPNPMEYLKKMADLFYVNPK